MQSIGHTDTKQHLLIHVFIKPGTRSPRRPRARVCIDDYFWWLMIRWCLVTRPQPVWLTMSLVQVRLVFPVLS